jgi:hypothetical protein
MRKKDERRAALENGADLVRGPKVKGPYGWYYKAVEPVSRVEMDISELLMWIAAILVLTNSVYDGSMELRQVV